MPDYLLTRAAEDDLIKIASYTVENFGVGQAIAYRDGLVSAFALLAENPKAARLREELKPPMRVYRFRSHMIIYDMPKNAPILIVRIRHGREDWLADNYA